MRTVPEAALSLEERRVLLAVARDGLEAAVSGREATEVRGEHDGALGRELACFITLYAEGQLRGCIGMLQPVATLGENIRAMARGAALRDPRFSPVTAEELQGIDLSVSVLSPPRLLTSPADWELGRDGLIVSRGGNRGVLLPQVATDRGWDFPTFVTHTCLKAGLPRDAWRDPETKIEVFSGTVYK